MLRIREYDEEVNYRILRHGKNVFHDALEAVLGGEKRFHVTEGPAKYDLEYVDNQQWAMDSPGFSTSTIYRDNTFYPPYLSYDESDIKRICLDIFDGYRKIWFERAGEYSIVLAGILAENTDLEISFGDDRITWFLPDNDRIAIEDEVVSDDVLRVFDDFVPCAFNSDYSTMDSMVLFHHVFFFQWLTPLKTEDIKYLEIMFPRTEGLGSVLLGFGFISSYFKKKNIEVTVMKGCTRYRDEFLEKHFNLRFSPADSNRDNTVYATNYYSIMGIKMVRRSRGLDRSVLNSDFVREMQEYAEAYDHYDKTLGILLRGSDYITTRMSGTAKAVSVASAVPTIREWLEKYGYEKIMLATEDQSILREMCSEFPGKIVAIAQERYEVGDFVDAVTINELDRQKHSAEEYNMHVEDTAVNYMYALYLLSECKAFMYSCHCGGAILAKLFNENHFERTYCFAEHI
ncbi:MAG: hypothetical protein Q4F31_07430 [Eubacteriales bacterium]|nr:hypothetical protein [Eubacteriales bacterium]